MQHREYAIGCDANVGGTTTAHFDYNADPARFHGVVRLAVRPGYEQAFVVATLASATRCII